MMKTNRFFVVLLIIIQGMFSSGCSDEDGVLESISIEPAYWEMNLDPYKPNTSKQFSAIGYYSDGSSENITSLASWRGTNSLSVYSSGIVEINKAGSFTLLASYNGGDASGSAMGMSSIIVNAIDKIDITPDAATNSIITKKFDGSYEATLGGIGKFMAIASYPNDATIDITNKATWNYSNTSGSDSTSDHLTPTADIGRVYFDKTGTFNIISYYEEDGVDRVSGSLRILIQ